MPWLRLREVKLTDDCLAEIAAAGSEFVRVEEAVQGLRWLLARNPTPVGAFSTTLYGMAFVIYGWDSAGSGMPDMWAVYRFDDTTVEIHGINAMAPDEADQVE
jgi:hypothetical protein